MFFFFVLFEISNHRAVMTVIFFCCSLWFEQVYMKWRCRKHLFVIERIGEWLQIYEREKGDRHLKCFPFCFVFGYSNVIFSSLIFLFVICIYRSHEKLNAFASAAPLTSRGNPADFLFLAASMMSAALRLFPLPPTHSVSLMPVPTGRIDLSHKLSQEIDGQRENDGRILLRRDGWQGLCQIRKKKPNDYSLLGDYKNWVHDKQVRWGRRRNNLMMYLKVPQLQSGRRLGDDHRGLFESSRGLVFSLGGDDFGAGLTGRFGFGRHGSLQLHRQTDVLTARWRKGRKNFTRFCPRHWTLRRLTSRRVPLWCPKIQSHRLRRPVSSTNQRKRRNKAQSIPYWHLPSLLRSSI